MRYVVARRSGRKGEGLGNEILPWAKGLIASQVLGAKLVGPSWGLNKRKYYRNFGTSRFDFLAEDLLGYFSNFSFSEDDYFETGEVDFGKAIEKWARRKQLSEKKSFVITVDGMYGGYLSIQHARPFLWSKLLNSRDAISNVYKVASKLNREKLFIAVHMRLGGDFTPLKEGEDARGKFNIAIPGQWYLNACQALKDEFGDDVQFHFFTDRSGDAFQEAIRRFNPSQERASGLTECSDLILMALADLRICSISSYSLVASFLSSGPYIWYEPQLSLKEGLYSLWGMERRQFDSGSSWQKSTSFLAEIVPGSPWESEFKGYCMATEDALPAGLVTQLRRKLLSADERTNLLEHGCIPIWSRQGGG
jgi:hypothetical protein